MERKNRLGYSQWKTDSTNSKKTNICTLDLRFPIFPILNGLDHSFHLCVHDSNSTILLIWHACNCSFYHAVSAILSSTILTLLLSVVFAIVPFYTTWYIDKRSVTEPLTVINANLKALRSSASYDVFSDIFVVVWYQVVLIFLEKGLRYCWCYLGTLSQIVQYWRCWLCLTGKSISKTQTNYITSLYQNYRNEFLCHIVYSGR